MGYARYWKWTATFFQSGHSAGFGGRMDISKNRKKITVDRVVDSRTPDQDHRLWPRSVSAKSWLTQIGTDAPNMSSRGRKIQFRWLRNRFRKRRMRSPSGISGRLKRRARTYGASVTPHAHRLIWLYWLICVGAQSREVGESP